MTGKSETATSGAAYGDNNLIDRANDLSNALQHVSKQPVRQVKLCAPSGPQLKRITTNVEADAMAVSVHNNDVRNDSNDLQNASEQASERAERTVDKNSPYGTQIE